MPSAVRGFPLFPRTATPSEIEMTLITRVDTGDKTEYLFQKSAVGDVYVMTCSRGKDDFARHYTDLDGRGNTAVRRLAESHAQLRRFFDAVCKLGVYDIHGRLTRIIEPDEIDADEESAAFELVREIMEEVADFEGLQD
jgi:hypothetical protein